MMGTRVVIPIEPKMYHMPCSLFHNCGSRWVRELSNLPRPSPTAPAAFGHDIRYFLVSEFPMMFGAYLIFDFVPTIPGPTQKVAARFGNAERAARAKPVRESFPPRWAHVNPLRSLARCCKSALQ